MIPIIATIIISTTRMGTVIPMISATGPLFTSERESGQSCMLTLH